MTVRDNRRRLGELCEAAELPSLRMALRKRDVALLRVDMVADVLEREAEGAHIDTAALLLRVAGELRAATGAELRADAEELAELRRMVKRVRKALAAETLNSLHWTRVGDADASQVAEEYTDGIRSIREAFMNTPTPEVTPDD